MPTILVIQSAADRDRYFTPVAQDLLRACGEVIWNELNRPLTADEVTERLPGCQALTTGWGGLALRPEVLAAGCDLRMIGVLGGSVKAYSPELCFTRGITICHTPAAIGRYVAEFALGLMLSLCYDLTRMDCLVRQRGKLEPPEGGYHHPGGWLATGLRGTVVGLIGSGAVATHTVNFLRPFECQLLMHDPYLTADGASDLGVEKCELEDLLRRCEILTVHAGWTPETEGMLTRERLALLRDGAIVVNTARMPICDEEALLAEVKKKRLKVALNLIPYKELWRDPALGELDNVLLSPGCATVARQTLTDMGTMLAEDMQRFFAGQVPQHVVTPDMLPRMT